MSWADKVWTVADVMVEDVVTVAPSTPYKRLVDLLWVHDIGALPVVDDRGALSGIVTESDLLARVEFEPQVRGSARDRHTRIEAFQKMKLAEPITAADVMTTQVETVLPEKTLTDTARLMRGRELKRLPVVDGSGKLVGIVTQSDLLKVFLRSEETIEWDVRDILKRHLHNPDAVKVKVEDGVVHLTGAVGAHEQTDVAVKAIDALPGVVAVQNHLARESAAH